MANVYWRIRLEGEAPTREVEAAASELGGTIVRVHVEKSGTQLYVAVPETSTRGAARPKTSYGDAEAVGEEEVTRIG